MEPIFRSLKARFCRFVDKVDPAKPRYGHEAIAGVRRWSGHSPSVHLQELNALEALKHPTHGRSGGRFVDLIGNGLPGFRQPAA